MATMTTNTASPTTARPRTADRTAGVVAPASTSTKPTRPSSSSPTCPAWRPTASRSWPSGTSSSSTDASTRRPVTPDYQEFELASYYRAFTLTDDLDAAGISATLRDGVLRIEIPKSPKAQPKKIPVRTE